MLRTIEDNEEQWPQAAATVRRDIFVDDLYTACTNVPAAIKLRQDGTALLAKVTCASGCVPRARCCCQCLKRSGWFQLIAWNWGSYGRAVPWALGAMLKQTRLDLHWHILNDLKPQVGSMAFLVVFRGCMTHLAGPVHLLSELKLCCNAPGLVVSAEMHPYHQTWQLSALNGKKKLQH